jgi:hypothetical protein
MAVKQSAKINRRYLEPVVVGLDVTGVPQIGSAILIMDMLPNFSGSSVNTRNDCAPSAWYSINSTVIASQTPQGDLNH